MDEDKKQIALFRYPVIAPLLTPEGGRGALKRAIAQESAPPVTGFSKRSWRSSMVQPARRAAGSQTRAVRGINHQG